MYNVYLIIPVIMFKIQMKFDVRDKAVACVLSVIFNIIGHVALYVDFAALCGVGMWAASELREYGVFLIGKDPLLWGYTYTGSDLFHMSLLVALVVFSVYEIINTVITAGSRK